MAAYHTEDITLDNVTYRVEYHHDGDTGAPWENCDGHGVVTRAEVNSYTGHIDKKPGQVVLHRGGRNEYSYLYDFADALKTAKRDGWNAKPYDAPNAALRAVNADMEFLRGWCANEWHYMGVEVFPLTEDGHELRSQSQSCWGIESCSDDYIWEVTNELIAELAHVAAR